MPPKVSWPLVTLSSVVGAKDIPRTFEPMTPALNALSVTVGTVPPPLVVPTLQVRAHEGEMRRSLTISEICGTQAGDVCQNRLGRVQTGWLPNDPIDIIEALVE